MIAPTTIADETSMAVDTSVEGNILGPAQLIPDVSGVPMDRGEHPTIFPASAEAQPVVSTDGAHHEEFTNLVVPDYDVKYQPPDTMDQMDVDQMPPAVVETITEVVSQPITTPEMSLRHEPKNVDIEAQVSPQEDPTMQSASQETADSGPSLPQESPLLEPQVSPRRKKKETRNIIIIEELDTPAIRREKNQRRREQKQRKLQAEKEAEVTAQAPHKTGLLEVDAGKEGHDFDMGSELSSLSDLSGDEDPGSKKSKHPINPPKQAEPGEIQLTSGKTLEGGTLGTYG